MIIQGLKWLSTQFPKSNHCIRREEITLITFGLSFFCLTGGNFVVFCEGTRASGTPLNDKKFGMLCGKH